MNSFVVACLVALAHAAEPRVVTASQTRQLRRGDNPPGALYRLPRGAFWSGEGDFGTQHLFPEKSVKKARCDENDDVIECTKELSRSLFVDNGFSTYVEPYPATMVFDSYIDTLVNLTAVTDQRILDIAETDLLRRGRCRSFKTPFPATAEGTLVQHEILLKLVLQHRTVSPKGDIRRNATYYFRSTLANGRCDSFFAPA